MMNNFCCLHTLDKNDVLFPYPHSHNDGCKSFFILIYKYNKKHPMTIYHF